MSKKPTGSPGSTGSSRSTEARIVERFQKLPEHSFPETGLQRKASSRSPEGDDRVRFDLKRILAIKDVQVREAVKEIIRNGNLNAELLERLTDVSGKVSGNSKGLVSALKNKGVVQSMEAIEKALRLDKTILVEHDTRRQVSQVMSTAKVQKKSLLQSYEEQTKLLYSLLRGNFFYLEDPVKVLKSANDIIDHLRSLALEADLLTRRVIHDDVTYQIEYFGTDFGSRVTTSPGEPSPPTELTEEERTRRAAERKERSRRFYP